MWSQTPVAAASKACAGRKLPCLHKRCPASQGGSPTHKGLHAELLQEWSCNKVAVRGVNNIPERACSHRRRNRASRLHGLRPAPARQLANGRGHDTVGAGSQPSGAASWPMHCLQQRCPPVNWSPACRTRESKPAAAPSAFASASAVARRAMPPKQVGAPASRSQVVPKLTSDGSKCAWMSFTCSTCRGKWMFMFVCGAIAGVRWSLAAAAADTPRGYLQCASERAGCSPGKQEFATSFRAPPQASCKGPRYGDVRGPGNRTCKSGVGCAAAPTMSAADRTSHEPAAARGPIVFNLAAAREGCGAAQRGLVNVIRVAQGVNRLRLAEKAQSQLPCWRAPAQSHPLPAVPSSPTGALRCKLCTPLPVPATQLWLSNDSNEFVASTWHHKPAALEFAAAHTPAYPGQMLCALLTCSAGFTSQGYTQLHGIGEIGFTGIQPC